MSWDHSDRLVAGDACLQAALDYLSRGIAALCCCDPHHIGVGRDHGRDCTSPGKRPIHRWRQFQERLPTREETQAWWHNFPIGNVGAVLGQVSGIVRVDVDGAEGESLLAAASGGTLPPTWTFRSSPARREPPPISRAPTLFIFSACWIS